MTPKQRIVTLVRQEYERAVQRARLAHAEHMGQVAAANTWDQFNPTDGVGGFSQNPHNVTSASSKDTDAERYMLQIREAYNLAVDTFLTKD